MTWNTEAVPRGRPSGAIIALAFALVGCASGMPTSDASIGGASSLPSAQGSPTATGTTAPLLPSPRTSTEPGGSLPHDSVAEVVTRDLVVRSEPGVHDGSDIYATRLNEPTFVYVVDGPVPADGFDWYLVQPFWEEGCMDACPWPVTFGWVAQAGEDGEQWVAPASISCPSPTVVGIQWLPLPGRLACFGDEVLQFEGAFGQCFNEKMGGTLFAAGCMVYTPGWEPGAEIRPPGIALRLGGGTPLTVQAKDGSNAYLPLPEGTRVRVTGQFDHPRSADCQEDRYPIGELQPEWNVELIELETSEQRFLRCRSEFVVSEVLVREQRADP